MYTLQRSGDMFEILEEPSGCGEAAGRSRAARHPTVEGGRASRVGYDQWKLFVETGQLRGLRLRSPVAASWKRCREWEVDPAPRSCWDFTPMEQLEPFASTLRELARDVEKKTYQAIKGRDLLITLTDAKARVLRTCGDLSTLRQADKLNFGPGANWAEGSVGTNAIGTALATGVPLQVFGEEHYCRSHHAWSCSAAPILDPQGRLWGCFDISGPVGADHSLAFDLVRSAARELERHLFSACLAELENTSRSLFSAVFNAVLTGVLTVDACGRITNANGAAEALLGQAGRGLTGRRADAFLDFGAYLAARRQDPSRTEAVDLACLANPRLMARATPVFSVTGACRHTIVTITEPQRVHVAPCPVPAPKPVPAEEAHPAFAGILTDCPAMRQAVRKAGQAARTPSTVLITGESGTGKELFARGIHQASARAGGPFVAVNCGALARELAQSELFGYRAGAFTGADDKGRIGKFEQADKGTLFLDEIAEMPLEMQVNLLRPLEERCVVRVGGRRCRPVDVKVIVATNRDLAELVAAGRFREDLYFRINVVGIHIPSLRQRGPEDVRLLAEHHARRLCAAFGLAFSGIDPAALDRLCAHDWPGNVRELINCVEYAVNVMEGGVIRPEHLPSRLGGARVAGKTGAGPEREEGFRLENVEVATIAEALAHHGGNVSQAARALGIGRNTLYAKMRKGGLR
jgi:transcriptional regulator of acetoin/glycerol metabolism